MGNVIKINLDSLEQEFEINKKVFSIKYDDVSLNNYAKKINSLGLSDGAIFNKTEDEQKIILKEIIELFFGESTFEEIYTLCGKSYLNVNKVLSGIMEWLSDKLKDNKQSKKSYYTKK